MQIHCVKSVQIQSYFWSVFSREKLRIWTLFTHYIRKKIIQLRVKSNQIILTLKKREDLKLMYLFYLFI